MSLVDRLRELALEPDDPDARDEDRLMREAADTIEQLERAYARYSDSAAPYTPDSKEANP